MTLDRWNLRDLGGIATADGRRVASGRLFRSGALVGLGAAEWAQVESLGIRLVCDLRSTSERIVAPFRWPGRAPHTVAFDLLPDSRTTGAAVMRTLCADPTGRAASAFLAENYALMPTGFVDGLRRLVGAVVDGDDVPLLICCREGKDRTGFACSVLLRALGVPEEAVIDEYLASAPNYDRQAVSDAIRAQRGGDAAASPSDAVLDALQVDPGNLRRAFQAIEEQHGGLTAYLEQAGGLDAERLSLLRGRLLGP